MSQSDYITVFWSAQEMGINALMLYLTVISGYLIVAYLVGPRLTRFQARFISCIFVVFALYALWGVAQYWATGDMARQVLAAGEPGKSIGLNYLGLNPAWIAAPMGVAGIVGALKFMWDVRNDAD